MPLDGKLMNVLLSHPCHCGDNLAKLGRWCFRWWRTTCAIDSPVHVSLRPVPMCREAQGNAETALLRLVKTLVQRLLGVGQAPQRRRPICQRIRAIAQTLGGISRLPRSTSRLALGDPLLADVSDRLLDRGPVLLLGNG
jgi:hypothetical protein